MKRILGLIAGILLILGGIALILVRILYFFDEGETIIATNGFIKKQQKTPRSEILLAKQRRTIYLKRKGSRR